MDTETLPAWWTGIEPRLPLLRAAVGHIETGEFDRARAALDELARGLDLERSPDQLAYLLAAGLQVRATPGDVKAKNLYLSGHDVPHLHLFQLLKQKDPLVRSVYPVANAIVCDLIGEAERATIIDLGTGDGSQLEAALEMLAEKGRSLRALTIVAIDLDAGDLAAAGSRLAKAAKRLGIDLTFKPIASMLEDLDASTWELLAGTPAPRVINATFALHHLQQREGGADARDEILDRIFALEPAGLVMCEPNADFNLPELRRRFRNAARFFGAYFDHIDRMDLDVEERRLLKFGFWGREILDVLGGSEEGRCERYETPHRWVSRLRQAGFQPYRRFEAARERCVAGATLTINEGFLGLGRASETILCVIAATRGEPVIDNAFMEAKAERAVVATPRRIDVGAYLRLLVDVAFADGVIHPLEREFIDRQASLAGIDPRTLWARGEPAGERLDTSASLETRRAVVRDCVLLSHIDGAYADAERSVVRAAAARLRIDDATVAELEAEASGYAPPLLTDVPGWLREHWALLRKTTQS